MDRDCGYPSGFLYRWACYLDYKMIEVLEEKLFFGLYRSLISQELDCNDVSGCREQLYAQMMGWV